MLTNLYNINRSEKWGKNIQAAASNGARRVYAMKESETCLSQPVVICHMLCEPMADVDKTWKKRKRYQDKDIESDFECIFLQTNIGV